MGMFRVPMVQVEEDGDVYWTAKDLNEMGLPWGLQQDTRVIDGYGIYRVLGSEAQLATLAENADVTRLPDA